MDDGKKKDLQIENSNETGWSGGWLRNYFGASRGEKNWLGMSEERRKKINYGSWTKI